MEVPCLYPNETAVLFATGPSLTPEIVEQVRPYHESGRVRAFGCNDSYLLVDYLDVHYACDDCWWDYNGITCLKGLPSNCHVWTQSEKSSIKFKINHIPGSHNSGLYIKDRNHIHFGSNSGFQLLNLAYHYGVRRFILLGYNMGPVNNKRHFFGNHPGNMNKDSPYETFRIEFNRIQKDIKSSIVNCTVNTSLTCFRQSDLLTELQQIGKDNAL